MAFGLTIRKRPKEEIDARVDELLKLVHLDGFADRYPSQLSGGQRQRMALARALAVQPRVLLLDEPFGALDATVRKELRAWLRRLHDEVHVTTVFVTHDQEEAMEVAEQIVVLNHGDIEQVGAPRELYEKPANEFVMRFVGPVSELSGRWIRPHDVEILLEPSDGAAEATIDRIVHLGFEVRVELSLGDGRVDLGPDHPRHRPRSSSWARVRSSGCGPRRRAGQRLSQASGGSVRRCTRSGRRPATTSASVRSSRTRAQAGPHGDPDRLQVLRGALVGDALGRLAANAGQRPLDRPDHLARA